MMKRVLLITTIVIVLLCGGCQKTISTDTESWSEIGNNSMGKTEKANSNSSGYSNSDSDENEVSNSSNVASDEKKVINSSTNQNVSSNQDESEIQRPEKVIKIFDFKCNYATRDDFKKETFYDSKNDRVMPYRLLIPTNYNKSTKYPVLLFLHGLGESGTDNEKQLGNIKNMFEYNGDLLDQAIIICPQTNEGWNIDKDYYGDRKGALGSVLNLLDEIKGRYSCDENRIYVTGLSMGGHGTWNLLQEYGNIFAAGMPICGWGDTSKGYALKDIPIRIYHSKDDPTVSFAGSSQMHQAILNAGGKKVKFIELDGLGHNSWDYAYSDREAICWLFAQNKVKNTTCEYEFIPYFRIVDQEGKTVISDKDVDDIYTTLSENEFLPIHLDLNSMGINKLTKAYKNGMNKRFTVYCSDEKIFTFTVNSLPVDNTFSITNVFTHDSYRTFYDIILNSIEG